MPRVIISNLERTQDPGPQNLPGWKQTIIQRIRDRELVPIISNVFGDDILFGNHDGLVERYQKYSNRGVTGTAHIPANLDLPLLTQIRHLIDERLADRAMLKGDYLNLLKNALFDIAEGALPDRSRELVTVRDQFDDLRFSAFIRGLGYPRFDEPDNDALKAALKLADMQLPIYITTCHHSFLESAIRYAGRPDVRTEFCRWDHVLDHIPPLIEKDFEPTPNEPLVYHLHGLADFPESLVLTEDDYLRFLIASREDRGKDTDRIDHRIRGMVSARSLMMIGYRLQDWEFRSLFWGLIEPRSTDKTSVVAIQLDPDDEEQKNYLAKYYQKHQFHVFWGNPAELITSLHERWKNG